MVTHDPGVAAQGDRVVFLVDGQVADDLVGPTAGACTSGCRRCGVEPPAAATAMPG